MSVNIINKIIITINDEDYEFKHIQDLIPECENNHLKVYEHNDSKYSEYQKNKFGERDYCSFKINYPKNISGVYLWVVDEKIIYIGETDDLTNRFNAGYGKITPYNCNINGQTTNCKMNGVVLDLFRQNKIISLYFLKTTEYKEVEKILLENITTEYNSKNN